MFFGSQPAVGLDIGSSCVKAVQLRRSGANIELEKFGLAPVQAEGVTGAAARQAKIDAIKRALSNAQITARQAVTGVNGESIIVRYLQLPEMPEDELRSALRFEAEEYIPYNLEDCYLDSDVLGKSADDTGASKVDVLLVSTRKDLIHEHAEMVRAAGIQPAMVDLDSFAFFNCFELNYQPTPTETVALVNIGALVTNINVYGQGTTRFSRDIGVAGGAITAAIRNKLSIDPAQAEELKMREGLPESYEKTPTTAAPGTLLDTIRGTVERITGQEVSDDSPEAVASRAARETMAGLATEIHRSIQFYENHPRSKPVERVIIGGGTARMRNIDKFLESELKLPVEILDPLRRISPHGRTLDTAALSEQKTILGVGIGLALRKLGD